ncbi:hypothetical protein Btru_011257, partial [Bulinus truncatus]
IALTEHHLNPVENVTEHKNPLFYKNFTFFENATGMMEVTTLATSALFVAGVFFNVTAIGVFGCLPFNRMSFTVYMKIICCFNIAVLFLGMIKHHSFMLDLQVYKDYTERHYLCIQTMWSLLVFEHSRAFSIALVIYNRIKAQRTADAHNKSLTALRIPVLANATLMLLCTVPVSSYIEEYMHETTFHNRSECVFAFLRPYNTLHATSHVIGNMPLLEESTNIALLLILMLEIFLKHWRYRRAVAREKMNARASTSDQLLSVMLTLKRSYPKGGSTATKETDEMHHYATTSGRTLSDSPDTSYVSLLDIDDKKEFLMSRDSGATTMTIAMVMFHLMTSGPRRIQHSPLLTEKLPHLMVHSFNWLAMLDIVQYCYMAVMFAVLCASSSLYRVEAYKMIFEMNIETGHSESSLANAARVMNKLLRRGSQETHRHRSRSISTISKEYGAVIENFELDKNALMLLTTDDHRPLPIMQTSVEVVDGVAQYSSYSAEQTQRSDTDLDYVRIKAIREKKLHEMLQDRQAQRQAERQAARERKRREMIAEIQRSTTTVKTNMTNLSLD